MRKVDQIICEMHEWVFQMEKNPTNLSKYKHLVISKTVAVW